MSGQDTTPCTRILLSFSSGYTDLAHRVERDLSAANIHVRYDKWEGGGGIPTRQCVANGLDDVAFVIPLLTPSDAATTWVGEEWGHVIYDKARKLNIPVLPIWAAGDREAIPSFLCDVSYADFCKQDYEPEFRRLVETIRNHSCDTEIKVPADERDLPGARSLPTPPANPLTLEVGDSLAALLRRDNADSFVDHDVPRMRDGLFYELGVRLPALHLRVVPEMPAWWARIVINDIPEYEAQIHADSVVVNESVTAMAKRGIRAEPVINPATGAEYAWIPAEHATAIDCDLTTWDAQGFLTLWLSAVLRRKAADFIGLDEAQAMLQKIERYYPHLVAESVPKLVSLFLFTEVLRRLVGEIVSIRNLRQILMVLAKWGRVEQDPLYLTEYVRCGLQRQLTHVLSRGTNELVVFLLHPDLETLLGNSIRHTVTGSYVDRKPDELARILNAIRLPVSKLPNGVQYPQILTTLEIRAAVRRLVAQSMPRLHVVSYSEVSPTTNIQPIGRISIDDFSPRRGITVGGVPLWA